MSENNVYELYGSMVFNDEAMRRRLPKEVYKSLTPALGDCTPDRLTAGRIDEFSRGLLKSGLSAKTVHDILVVLRGVLV